MAAPLPPSIAVALKEWATVCRALESGRQIVLLRKGGIYESAGEFEVENRQFLLFPTYLHQNLAMLKPEAHEGFQVHNAEPERVTLALAGEVTDILELNCRDQMDELDDQHVWAPPLIDMRFKYRPENPLYLLLVRAYRLAEPVTVENTPAYAGCKSWVPLEQAIATAGAQPVLDDTTYQTLRQLIRARLQGVSTGF
ncbi:MAG TPA: DUF1802 family protein [Tepidisphaeraceae bacterium]|jgi:hypothetical protein